MTPENSAFIMKDKLIEANRRELFGMAGVEVESETHLEFPFDNRIIVDDTSNRIDQLDDQFGHIITRSCFTADHDGARNHHDVWVGLDPVVHGNHVETVQKLTFVFVNSFNLF